MESDSWDAPILQSPLVQLQRQPVRVGEERKPLAGVGIDPHRLGKDPVCGEMGHRLVDVSNLERQMP